MRALSTQATTDTADAILSAARKVLLAEGYERFTTRKAAKAAGITLGNLTYHYPSKRQLTTALIRRLLAEYSSAFEVSFAELAVPPDRKFKTLIEWLMADAVSTESNRLFRELWAMALHDRVVARAIDDFYDQTIERIAQLLCLTYPAMRRKSAMTIAHLLATVSEGTGVIYGTRRTRAASHADVMALAVDVLTGAVRDAAIGSSAATS